MSSLDTKKRWFIGNKASIFIFIVLIVIIFFWKPIIHSSVSVVCGSFVRESVVHGGAVYVFIYKTRNGKEYTMHESKSHFNVQSNELHKIKCIKIEYSNIFNFSSVVIDKRIKKDK